MFKDIDSLIDSTLETMWRADFPVYYPDLIDENGQKFNRIRGEHFRNILSSKGLIEFENERMWLTEKSLTILQKHQSYQEYLTHKKEIPKEENKRKNKIVIKGGFTGNINQDSFLENSHITNNIQPASKEKDKRSITSELYDWINNNKILCSVIAGLILAWIKGEDILSWFNHIFVR